MAPDNYIAPLWEWGVVPLVVVNFAVSFHFLKRLENLHNEVWQQLGSPTLLERRSLVQTWPFFRYVFSDRYKSLNDRALRPYIWTMRLLLFASLVYVAALVSFAPHLRLRLRL